MKNTTTGGELSIPMEINHLLCFNVKLFFLVSMTAVVGVSAANPDVFVT